MSTSFRLTAHIEAKPDTVYAALTDARALEEWLAEHAQVSIADGQFEFWGRDVPHGEHGRQRLIDADPGRLLRIGWEIAETDTEVELALQPDGAGTLLTLTQSDSEDWEGDDAGVRDFWARAALALTEHVEGRPPAPRFDFSRRRYGEARAEIDIAAPPERVFASLIEPAELDHWIADGAEVEPRVGGRIDFGWDHGPIKILDLEPPERLAYSWSNAGQADTVVRWELEGSAGRTHLTVVHSGFADGRPADGYAIGWLGFLISLKRMHELGPAWRKLDWKDVAVSA
jgi:uncharacterized protein YndB with AHSA1/START domain